MAPGFYLQSKPFGASSSATALPVAGLRLCGARAALPHRSSVPAVVMHGVTGPPKRHAARRGAPTVRRGGVAAFPDVFSCHIETWRLLFPPRSLPAATRGGVPGGNWNVVSRNPGNTRDGVAVCGRHAWGGVAWHMQPRARPWRCRGARRGGPSSCVGTAVGVAAGRAVWRVKSSRGAGVERWGSPRSSAWWSTGSYRSLVERLDAFAALLVRILLPDSVGNSLGSFVILAPSSRVSRFSLSLRA